jgi:hypothetical protein
MIVLAGEQQRGPLAGEVLLEGGGLAVQLGGQFRIGRFLDQLEGRQEIRGPSLEAAPQLDFVAQSAGFPEDLLGFPLVIPEPGLGRLRL